MREVRLHDTHSGELITLRPRSGGEVGIYACGPTVYRRIHVGNARPFVVFSLLRRFLAHEGYAPRLVVNITDVNDKIYAEARVAGVSSQQLAREMTGHYLADTEALGLGRPDAEPLASETIAAIVALIETLIARGHAYVAAGDVYFSVRSFPAYGSLSHRQVDDMDQGEDSEWAERKRDPLDFALWKAAKPEEDSSWEAPWGRGRPGWHIECSAMAERLLGLGFEVHGGGADLVFPHHENEAAQTVAAHGEPLAQIWMHNGMLRVDRETMSKSIGNVTLLHEAIARHGHHAVLMYLCGSHYRKPIDFSEAALAEASARVARVREAGRRLAEGPSPQDLARWHEQFFVALADDFNTAEALNGALFPWVREANARGDRGETVGDADLRDMLAVLGLDGLVCGEGDEAGELVAAGAPADVRALVERRVQARRKRDFTLADRLRDELAELGWEVRDGAGEPQLIRLRDRPP
ncbi:MAG: cysteine--tRNA ligase [Solirubrobacteraceae bacterium]|nr:MAG: cysteine--tRNA ligase [Solirubrobacterales bacterium]